MVSNTSSFVLLRHLGLLSAAVALVTAATDPCVPGTFSFPSLSGAEGRTITASSFKAYKGNSGWRPEAVHIGAEGVSVCNVTVSYTHPGENDLVNVHIWLPLENYKSRFVGVGGGGWKAGEIGDDMMSMLAYQGYAAAATDAGYNHIPTSLPDSWLLESPGKLAIPLLTNFAHRAAHDMTVISKHIVEKYYNEEPKFSYWNGCSTGGRQGLDLAQRYPEDYDGIWAACPAVSFPALLMSLFWPQVVMNIARVYPSACQFEAVRMAAIEACDELDHVKDGVISRDDLCEFDPETVIGKEFDCQGTKIKISKEVAEIVKAMLQGPVDTEGKQLFPGTSHGTAATGFLSTANTICTGESCTAGRPFPIAADWIRLPLKKDASFDVTKISREEFVQLFHQSVREYNDLIGSNNPDLRGFREAGKKMITWHATNDEAISFKFMRQYYDSVSELDEKNNVDTKSYYRYFEIPGLTHCSAPAGVHYPLYGFDALRRWVEDGVIPTVLDTVLVGERETDEEGVSQAVYPYPSVSIRSGDSFIKYDTKKALDKQEGGKDEL
ncbi:hypothetical protein G7Z17_g1656 [Cylindrodendrum hubeiense]|uniref:Carboxylic ester hydrolase n=1 Tax=Cylindrodendrum hubeiense TaxID=595255 RepID=A0A9P5HFP1_9HYPO|nr:hypothetical protein G7Z17_g1656 [Cylindrodendrum hubeiense]